MVLFDCLRQPGEGFRDLSSDGRPEFATGMNRIKAYYRRLRRCTAKVLSRQRSRSKSSGGGGGDGGGGDGRFEDLHRNHAC